MRHHDQLREPGAGAPRTQRPITSDIGRRTLPAALWSPQTVAVMQREVGNAAVHSLLVQRVQDYNAAVARGAIGRGTGRTASLQTRNGAVHIHLIRDAEGLGLVENAFLRFEDRKGPQHIMLDRNGHVVPTALSATGPRALVDWAIDYLIDFVTRNCPALSPREVTQRRRAMEQERQRAQAERDALPPRTEPSKAVYTGKQAGLFG